MADQTDVYLDIVAVFRLVSDVVVAGSGGDHPARHHHCTTGETLPGQELIGPPIRRPDDVRLLPRGHLPAHAAVHVQ